MLTPQLVHWAQLGTSAGLLGVLCRCSSVKLAVLLCACPGPWQCAVRCLAAAPTICVTWPALLAPPSQLSSLVPFACMPWMCYVMFVWPAKPAGLVGLVCMRGLIVTLSGTCCHTIPLWLPICSSKCGGCCSQHGGLQGLSSCHGLSSCVCSHNPLQLLRRTAPSTLQQHPTVCCGVSRVIPGRVFQKHGG